MYYHELLNNHQYVTSRCFRHRLGCYNAGIYDWPIGTFCSNSLYFIVSNFWNVGGARVLRLDVDSNLFFDMGFLDVSVIGGSGYLVKI